MRLMEENATRTVPPGMATEWTAMSYQEKVVGHQMYFVFVMALLLVYLVLAGQYESWYAPLAVICSVPLALIGPVLVFSILHIDNNLYTQIGVILLIALSAKNAILIVEVARERRLIEGRPILAAAVDAARARFRAILMTSFAFILGVAPLVVAKRRRRERAQVDRHHGVQRNAGLDLSCGTFRAVDILRGAALRGMACRP
jgi:hydrophobic/amphiphilic exporter-1 (mainly G- bacteria), HAE1 family